MSSGGAFLGIRIAGPGGLWAALPPQILDPSLNSGSTKRGSSPLGLYGCGASVWKRAGHAWFPGVPEGQARGHPKEGRDFTPRRLSKPPGPPMGQFEAPEAVVWGRNIRHPFPQSQIGAEARDAWWVFEYLQSASNAVSVSAAREIHSAAVKFQDQILIPQWGAGNCPSISMPWSLNFLTPSDATKP